MNKPLKQFMVHVREVHSQGYNVKAKNEKEAIKRVQAYMDNSKNAEDVEFAEGTFEYTHILPSKTWTVETLDEQE